MLKGMEQARIQAERLKQAFGEAIKALPDNPEIKRLSDRAFVINFKDLGDNMSPFYHDFKAQYRKLSEIVDKAGIETVASVLQRIIEKGTYYEKGYRDKGMTLKFNPVVIEHLKELMQQ